MKPDNYMSFSIVAGFFVGLAFSIAKFDEAEFVVLWTIITTMGIYLIVAVCISLYFWFLDFEDSKLKKGKLESNLEFYRLEFDKREKESAKIRNFIKSIESDDEEANNDK
ncbi:hypothetical protein LS68_004580 [Helicobacter sp. MIT 05-5293]|uniref:Motility integral membrane protein n=1 Tax=uncultured Helicobacter sp. TaxID=175537 RepID=A0A650EMB6_9HELI|nr:hypothetical protein [Helicobacter sp. MIT 05-5293]QGT50288.1 hypothetical protein Helico6505_1200 [uncultured Helicobacter sp.]TLD80765.1 hypothetical protein LS68_004580 [Helicobacter sp. MIT 05-5293]